jgi:hypothetical protein
LNLTTLHYFFNITYNMAFSDEMKYRTNGIKSYFRGGVKKSIWIVGGISLLMSFPMYYTGNYASKLYKNNWFNSKEIVQQVANKKIMYRLGTTESSTLSNGLQDLYISVDNKKNTQSGLSPWVYNLQVLDKDNVIIRQDTVRSYLLPGSSTYVIAKDVDPAGVKINIVDDSQTVESPYNPNLGKLFQEPKVIVTTATLSPAENSDEIRVRAVLKNEDLIKISSIDVLYILRDNRQDIVGAGSYKIGGLLPATERELIVDYPKPKDKEAKFVEIRWFTNYLDKNNLSI